MEFIDHGSSLNTLDLIRFQSTQKFNLIPAEFVSTISVHIETFDVTLDSNVQGTPENDCFQLGISLYFQAFVVRYDFRYLIEFVSFETDQAIAIEFLLDEVLSKFSCVHSQVFFSALRYLKMDEAEIDCFSDYRVGVKTSLLCRNESNFLLDLLVLIMPVLRIPRLNITFS